MRPRQKLTILAALVVLAGVNACGPSAANSTATPQAKVAHHGATVLNAVAELQRGVTAAATASPAFVPAARTITGIVERIHAESGRFVDALRAYDTASTIELRDLAKAQSFDSLARINQLINEAFGVKVSDDVAGQVFALIANVGKVVSLVSSEVAKLRAL